MKKLFLVANAFILAFPVLVGQIVMKKMFMQQTKHGKMQLVQTLLLMWLLYMQKKLFYYPRLALK